MTDILVIGGGPAGLSAAINAAARGKSALVVSNPVWENPLYPAPVVDNYPGMPGISGAKLLNDMEAHAVRSGVELRHGRVLSVMPAGDTFYVSIGSRVEQVRAVILALGVTRTNKFPGEERLLGRGVSWCATCDGMLYRGRDVVVIGLSHDGPEEANFLQEIGCRVTYAAPKRPEGLRADIPTVLGKQFSVEGEREVEAVWVDDRRLPCQGVFVLRQAVAPTDLVDGLELSGNFVATDREMATNIPGIYACGDCVGLPLQIAKAVGEGLIAGQNAAQFVNGKS